MQRLLVIEDEPGIGKVVSRALSSARFQIDCAADGRSGLQMAGSGHHDLVLTDLMRPSPGRGGAGLTVTVGRRTPWGTFTPTLKATSGSIAHQATTKLTVK